MPEYLFDVKLFAAVRVQASDEGEARKMLDDALNCASCNAGSWPNGDPILFEASADGEADLSEVDGEPVDSQRCADCGDAPATTTYDGRQVCEECKGAAVSLDAKAGL